MSAVKNKISQALNHNSSKTGGSRSARQPLVARTGGLRIVNGDEAHDSSRHLGDLSLDVPGNVSSHDGGTMDMQSTSRSAGIPGAQTQAATSTHTTHTSGATGEINQVVDTQIFTRTEDRQVVVRTVIRELHHRPIEKQYQVQTRYVGARRVEGAPTELVGTEMREIEERLVEAPAGDRKVVIENVDIPREALQSEVIDIARHRATGVHSTTNDSNTSGGTAVASSSSATASAAVGSSGTTTARPSNHSATGSEFGSSVQRALASPVGSPYSITQPGTVLEDVDQILDTHTFTKTEDYEVIVETVIHELHHRPVQKQYMVQTRLVGERRVPGAATEFLGTEEREVEERLKRLAACDRTVVVKNVDVPADFVQTQVGSTREMAGSSTGVGSASHLGSPTSGLHTSSGARGTTATSYGASHGTEAANMAHRERGSSGAPAVSGMSGSSGSAGAFGMQDRKAVGYQQSGGMTTGTTGMTSGTPTGTTGMTGGSTVGTTGVTSSSHHHSSGGIVDTSAAQVIDSKTFTKTEDHEVLLEKKAYELQHKPVEKQYVVETKYVGEQAVPGKPSELVGTEAREVEERVVEAPAGDRAVVVENVDVPVDTLRQTTTTSGMTGTTGAPGSRVSGAPGSSNTTTGF